VRDCRGVLVGFRFDKEWLTWNGGPRVYGETHNAAAVTVGRVNEEWTVTQ